MHGQKNIRIPGTGAITSKLWQRNIIYGLGQGATMVAAFWGVFVWKEFKEAPTGTNRMLALMFIAYAAGLCLIIAARIL